MPSFAMAAPLLLSCFLPALTAHAFVLPRDAPTLVPALNSSLPTNWTYLGCWNDTVQSRTLGAKQLIDAKNMNGSVCTSYCNQNNYIYAGTEYGDECYCGNQLGAPASLQNDTSCSMSCASNGSEACGAANFLSVYYANQPAPLGPQVNPGPANWTSYGCWTDGGNPRTLPHQLQTPGGASNISVALCTEACSSAGYTLCGMEYAGECYGDNYLAKTATNATNITECNMPCNGNSSEFCGAGNRLNLYALGTTIPGPKPPAKAPSIPVNWNVLGCYSDSVQSRSLANGVQVPGGAKNMTNAGCAATCFAAGYTIAGTEYSGECWCDNSFKNNAAPVTDGRCSMNCQGNSNDVCGGSNGLTVLQFNNWFYISCFSDNVGGRTLKYGQQVPGGAKNMTVENCMGACSSAGYTLAGVEYSGECFCDNQISNGGGPASDGEAQCTMPCYGAQYETCGGPNRLNLYAFNTTNIPTTSSTTSAAQSTSPTSIASTTPASSAPVSTSASVPSAPTSTVKPVSSASASTGTGTTSSLATGGSNATATSVASTTPSGQTVTGIASDGGNTKTPSGTATTSTAAATPSGLNATAILPWKYQGCYTDTGNGRSLTGTSPPDSQQNTIESCISACTANGYSLAGLQWSQQCFCDNYLHNSPSLVDDSNCQMPCTGNKAEYCGSGGHNSVYANGTLSNFTAPGPLTNLPANYSYVGCYQDNANNQRVFPYQLNFPSNNSNGNCISACSAFGYPVAATEYANQCFCGDWSDFVTVNPQKMAESACFMRCSNDTSGSNGGEICGGGGTLSIYSYNGTTGMDSWTYASGNAAGAYQFLIGGVVIPLITAPARNGKVTYIEKFGTSENASSTGAYELDLAQLNNFTAAWRPMHVKTDVFCSAGLTLPDRSGRQINVGGWSRPSTQGIRLYIPDGSPGVAGQNDWQEDVDNLHLLDSRWYPSAMMMSNGSILVMGGEQGSNGAPTPTLELLPAVNSQSQFCDYLNATDPYNLYPFLITMPSGNIFVGYYNQAKLLDPVSLQPVKDLPKMPGAVNNADAGRTYPAQGTAVLLPQRAPYGAPAEVLICGGSTPFGGFALDNCITIQPDTPNANWTLERMPSKRVMPNIAALPDGTYLIANGAHQGNAGFGLATSPNLGALLYDPTKPLHQRMTVMANTTVARLYHSEAVLLDDGRVLISGSDPEDKVNPQEYRNEVFIPPYLMGSPSRPEYNISTIDLSYGGSATLTMSSPGAGGPYQVTMMGAVSSTHGNSMGQRTLFVATSCSGSSCTITAPPSSSVAPPGWFQVFLLDGKGVPSHATWVRVGGDPASLGNWPNISGFKTPGMGAPARLF